MKLLELYPERAERIARQPPKRPLVLVAGHAFVVVHQPWAENLPVVGWWPTFADAIADAHQLATETPWRDVRG